MVVAPLPLKKYITGIESSFSTRSISQPTFFESQLRRTAHSIPESRCSSEGRQKSFVERSNPRVTKTRRRLQPVVSSNVHALYSTSSRTHRKRCFARQARLFPVTPGYDAANSPSWQLFFCVGGCSTAVRPSRCGGFDLQAVLAAEQRDVLADGDTASSSSDPSRLHLKSPQRTKGFSRKYRSALGEKCPVCLR